MILLQYMSAIAQVGCDLLGWLDSGIIRQIELPEGCHAVDQHNLQFTFDLWTAMSKLILQHEAPLPAGKHLLLPEVVATWNQGKGSIDVYRHF